MEKILEYQKILKYLNVIDYQVINEPGEIINETQITVACVKKSTGKACIPPKRIVDTMKELMNK